jgi:beta-mannosidase
MNQVKNFFGKVPESIEDFILASQIVQAESDKFMVEFYRQQKWRTGGIILWNMVDSWPQVRSNAVVDYYAEKKLAFHYLKRVHVPLCVILKEPHEGKLEVAIANDSLTPGIGSLHIVNVDTKAAWDFQYAVDSNGLSVAGFIPEPKENTLFTISWSDSLKNCSGVNHYLFGKPSFDFEKYRRDWLPAIAGLDSSFDAAKAGKS